MDRDFDLAEAVALLVSAWIEMEARGNRRKRNEMSHSS